ncbi:hypothetical protein [Natrinema gelatinilyticum]|uniref:hypothetical protein n=1 Tax=Natrinema gelatinilyticum TaxID=2961571 RepID=UPI0020C501EC|nr:hypothetical protein [Natrinema gelatinilyticum]
MYIYLVDVLADETVGSDLGALRAVCFTIDSLGPVYVGTAATRLAYTASFASLLFYFGLAVPPLIWLADR